MHLKREGLGVVSIGRGPNGEDGVTSFAELQAVLSDGPASRLVTMPSTFCTLTAAT